MKKLYIDIRFAKCLLALTAGWLMAGCSAEDELGNGSAAQQLSMTPMVNDLQTTRVKEEENLHEKTLSSLDFKMFGPTSSELRIDRQFDTPAENKAEELGSGDWKSTLHLDVNNTYPYYAVANAKENLKGKNLKELLASTQQDDDIWMPATEVSDKKFLMSSQGEYTITQDPEQNIPVELVRAAAKIKLNISSTVKDYKITKVMWKFINYNTNTAIFAGQPATPNIIKDNQEYDATADKDNIYKITTYSYSTTWNGKDDMPQFVADVTFEKNTDAKTTIIKHLVIPVRDPQGEKKLDRNYIYTVNAVIKYLDTKTDIDYDGKEDYLKWAITKWTEGEDTHVNADGASYLVVSPTAIDIKGGESNDFTDYTMRWFASNECDIENPTTYYFDRYGNKQSGQDGQIKANFEESTGNRYRGWIDVHAGAPSYCTIQYSYFNIKVRNADKKQEIAVRKYPSVYSMNVRSEGTNDFEEKNHLYTIQFSSNKYATDYTIAKPVVNNENMSADNTVSPAYILASTAKGERKVENNQAARDYCKKYQEKATTYKGESLKLNGWRLPTKEEINRIYKLGNEDKAISKQLLRGEYYWTLDGDKSERNGNNTQSDTYVRCVHDLTPGEIELIEKQGEK
uniref:fimbrial tip adhesin FimD n=1 Tax=Segatella copri TaxID=165179 RepID=UPI003FEF8DE7